MYAPRGDDGLGQLAMSSDTENVEMGSNSALTAAMQVTSSTAAAHCFDSTVSEEDVQTAVPIPKSKGLTRGAKCEDLERTLALASGATHAMSRETPR